MSLYVSGGMTGWPDNNEHEFDYAAATLRMLGHEVETPVEWGRKDNEVLKGDGFNATDEEYEGFLARDLARINRSHFDGIVFIKGWMTSGGAGREGRKAIQEGLKLYIFVETPQHGPMLVEVTPRWFKANSRVARLRREEVEV